MKIAGIGTISKEKVMSVLTREGREAVKSGDITLEELGDMYKLEMVNGLKTSTLDFGEDGSYMAYVVDEDAEIGAHYKKVADFKHWLKIYDDDELTYRINAQEINIYRAGDFGCIIQTIGRY